MRKNKVQKLILLVVLLGLLFLGIKTWWGSNFAAVSTDKSTQSFIVAKSQSVSEIADNLKTKKLIRSPFFFKIYLKQQGLDSKLQEGTFKLSPAQSLPEIAKTLTSVPNDAWVTLLEGWRVEEMASKLNSQLKIETQEFIKKAKKYEGYLFPDTYLFPKEATVDYIIKTLRDNFNQKYSEDVKKKIRSEGLTEDEGVILASIVEREARSDEARKMVASILLKRLNIEMGLNADATIQYALGFQPDENPPRQLAGGGWWKRHLTRDDLKVDSPYNTYIHRGLPPTPICNPSLSSLQVVANANPETPYLYYYHDSKGISHYATTLQEHNENVANNP